MCFGASVHKQGAFSNRLMGVGARECDYNWKRPMIKGSSTGWKVQVYAACDNGPGPGFCLLLQSPVPCVAQLGPHPCFAGKKDFHLGTQLA